MSKKRSAADNDADSALNEFKNHPVANLLGIRILSVTRKRVKAEMHVTPSHFNRSGRVGGGLIMTFADILGARGTTANLPKGARTATIESKTNFFASGKGPKLIGVSVPLHIGQTTMVWQTTVSNADGKKVAIATQTQIVMRARSDAAPMAPRSREKAKRVTGNQ